ncbi:MAG: MFS transporter [Candidatus Rokubacteria bacterium]|nr:MFS transporter [Candidatus Rokubacteria bacterium]MBI4256385.1 MFS transporter [Candidatus Rokubacteria bacterium]
MALPRDVRAVFAAKTARTFGYGFLGVLLPVYLTDLGLGATAIGAVVTLLLAGSAGLTWAVRRPAELWGSRTTLLGLAVLSVLAAGLLVATHEPWLVVLAALLANVAVGTGETGPFLTLDQVLVARAVPAARRTTILSWYNLLGYGAAAVGAATIRVVPAPRALFAVFLLVAVVQCAAYAALGRGLAPARRPPGAPRPSAPLIRRLAALFALDSFAGGFVLQALVAYFLHARYGLGLEALGGVFFVVQLLTAVSLLLAARAARRFGLLPTMVVSHLVSNAVLVAIAFAPTAAVAVGLLFVRHLLSQMDVPTRQAYVMAVVEDHEREAAATATNLARTAAQAVTPALTGWVMQAVALSAPFALGGGLKIVYDLLLYWTFKDVKLKRDA